MYAQKQLNGTWRELRGNVLFSPNIFQTAESLTPEQRAQFNVYEIIETPPPAHDPRIQVAERNGYAYNTDADQWETSWRVRPMTSAEATIYADVLKQNIVDRTQQRLDDFARTRSYDGILSACTYASSKIQKFQIEGQYCVDKRDQTWAALYAIMQSVDAGAMPPPTGFEDIEPLLPELIWPA